MWSAGDRAYRRTMSVLVPSRTPTVDARPALALGLVGALVVAVGTLGDGRLARTALARPLLEARHAPDVRPTSQVLLFLGLLVLTVAWWLLGRAVRGRADGPRTVTRAALLWSAPLVLTPPAFSGDLWSYVANAMISARGLSPYAVTPSALSGPIVQAVAARWRDAPTPYGPVPLLWGDLVGHLTTSPWLLLLSFRGLALVGLALLAYAVPRLATLAGRDPAAASWLAVASPFTIVHGVASAHVDIVLAGLIALGVLVALRGRRLPAAVLIGLAAAVKVPALLAVVPVVLASTPAAARWHERLRTTVIVAGIAGVVLLGLGPVSGLGNGWIGDLRAPLSGLSRLSLTTQLGRYAGLVTGHPLVAPAQAIGEAVIALVAVVSLRAGAGTAGDVVRRGALVMSVAVLLSPVDRLWYFFWALPLLAAAPLATWPRRTTIAVTTVLAWLAPLDPGQHLPQSRRLMELGVVLALLAGLDLRRAGAPLAAAVRRARS